MLSQKNARCSLEIIVVDDGSTDNTKEVLAKLKDKIRYYEIKHTGLPAVARNFGIAKAKGELIAFQDSDDLWAQDKLAVQVPLFADPDLILSYGQTGVIGPDGESKTRRMIDPKKLKYGQSFEGLLKENVISTLTTMVRKAALTAIGGFNEAEGLRAVEDYELWLRLLAAYPGCSKAISQTLAYHRDHGQNISSTDTITSIERLLGVYDRLWEGGKLSSDHLSTLEKQLAVMHENWSRQQNIEGNTPAISVVMSMYNSPEYLREAIDSILNQTFKDFEFIIINDGSLDNSDRIVRAYKDPRIRLVHQNNHGLVFSFNKGVKLARAKYIARMDADDISLPSRFQKEIEWLEAKDTRGLVGTYFTYMDMQSRRTSVTMVWPTKHLDLRRTMYYVNPFGHGTIMARREAIVGVGGYRSAYEPSEDADLWTRIARHWEVGQIPEVLYLWRFHEASISRRKSEVSNRAAERVKREMWQQPVVDKPLWAIFRDAYFYKGMVSPYSKRVYREYRDNQARLAAEFLSHGKLWIGYKTGFAALLLSPRFTASFWETFLRAPVKYLKEHR